MDRIEISPNWELTFDGRILSVVQKWKDRSHTAKFDVGLADWKLKPYTTLFKRRKQLIFTIPTPPRADGAQMVTAEGDEADQLRAFVERVFR